MNYENDNDAPQTLDDLALILWEVCDRLEIEGERKAADYLRDQCECVVRESIQEQIK